MRFLRFDMDRTSTSLYYEYDDTHMVKIEFKDDLFHATKYEKIGESGFGKIVGHYKAELTPSFFNLNKVGVEIYKAELTPSFFNLKRILAEM